MRPLNSHFRDEALTTLDTGLKQTKEARVFRRAQAVREVVAGHYVNAVSATFHFTNSALRTWVQRFAQQEPQGLVDRPRPGRPPQVTCELETSLNRLVDQDPLEHGSLYSYDPGKFRECLAEKPWHAHGNLTPWIGHFYPELAKVGKGAGPIVRKASVRLVSRA